jgi:hypothetical protein
MNNFKKGQQISVGNFIVSIGSFDISDVAIISKSSGNFVLLKQTKISPKLKRVKRLFKSWLNSDSTFTFQFMDQDQVVQIINILK